MSKYRVLKESYMQYFGVAILLLPKIVLWFVFVAGSSQSALATILDSDYYCRIYGCLMIGDGTAYDVYDVYNFTTGEVVPIGGQLIRWSGNPIVGVGNVDVLVSGTQITAEMPGTGEGVLLGLDQNGDQLADESVQDINETGYLDLGDAMTFASLSSMTTVVLKDRAYKHSIYMASRTDFEMFGQASLLSQSVGFANSVSAVNTGFQISKVQSGSDDGVSFGGDASNPRFRASKGVNNLNDLWGVPTKIAVFRRANGTHRLSASALADQSVRVDFEYQPPMPDFSLGTGTLDYRVEYSFYNR